MEILQTLIVAPLSLLYEGLFELVQLFVHNLGPALLVLSLVTAFLMIPVEKAVRRSVDKESLLKEVMLPQLAEIKAKYKGRERNDAIKDLYYRYRYNPLYSIRSSLGILVQIPFLLGAFWMLSSYAPLNGSHFWKIKDLGIPDGLLLGINLLPILMTVINLATIVVSRLSKRDAVQALVIALLFLVLLYDAPSALLLYWTSNNVIHFLRALVKRYYKCLKLPHVKTRAVSFIKSKAQFLSSRIDSLAQRIGLINAVFVVLLVFGVLLRLIGVITHKDGWRMAVYLDLALMISVLAIPVIKLLLNKVLWTKAQILKRVGFAVVLFFSLCTVIKILGLALLDLSHHHQGRDGAIAIILLLLIANPEFVKICLKKLQIALSYVVWLITGLGKNKFVKGKGSAMFVTAVGIICATCFVIIPLRFYVQNFQSLWFTGSSLFTYVLGVAIVSVLALTVIKRLSVPRLLGAFALMLATCVVIQSFIWPQQVKELIGYKYDWLGSPLTWINLAIWIVLLTVGVLACFKIKAVKYLSVGFNLSVLCVVVATTAFESFSMEKYKDSAYDTVSFDKSKEFVLAEKNIIVFILDTFDQETFAELRQSDGVEIEKMFQGFTWYKNNTGSGIATSYSIPYMFTGEFFKKNEDYSNYIKRAYASGHGKSAIELASSKGYRVRIFSEGSMFSNSVSSLIDNAFSSRNWGYARINSSALNALRIFVNYNIAPDFVRSKIKVSSDLFDSGKVALKSDIKIFGENDPLFYDDYQRSPFRVGEKGKNFIFYHLEGAHPPYTKGLDGKRVTGNNNVTKREQVLGCLRQLAKMFKTLQQIDKFKDSTIVVTADHGYHGQVKTSYPLLIAKEAGFNADIPLKESMIPTGHKDLLFSILNVGIPTAQEERFVLDDDCNIWKAPAVVTGDAELFSKVRQNLSEEENFTTEGISAGAFWGRQMAGTASIHFKDAKEEFIKLVIRKLDPQCNGFVNFNENGHVERIFLGSDGSGWHTVLYKRSGHDLKITTEYNDPKLATGNSWLIYPLHGGRLYDAIPLNQLKNEFYLPKVGETIPLTSKLDQDSHMKILRFGFGAREQYGTWTAGREQWLAFRRLDSFKSFDLKFSPFLYKDKLKQQRLVIKNEQGNVLFNQNVSAETVVHLDAKDFKSEFESIPLIKICFETPDAQSPADLGVSTDQRLLGVYMKSITVNGQ